MSEISGLPCAGMSRLGSPGDKSPKEDRLGHVTFVHGIANKPERDVLLAQWRVALLDDDGLDLDAMGVTASMVYWADILYGMPAPVGGVQESAELELAAAVCADDADMTWLGQTAPTERRFVSRLAREVGLTGVPRAGEDATTAVPPRAASAPSAWEALPLPWWLKERLIRVFLQRHFPGVRPVPARHPAVVRPGCQGTPAAAPGKPAA